MRSLSSSPEVVRDALRAAVLAHERAGTITLSIEEVGRLLKSPRLVSRPTGATAEWPSPTLESRLRLQDERPVADALAEWLVTKTKDPWHFAARKLHVMAVLRGLAELTKDERVVRRRGARLQARNVPRWLATVERERPELWKALDQAIEEGLKQRRDRSDSANAGDPWAEESSVARRRFVPHQLTRPLSPLGHAALGAWLVVAACFVALHQGAERSFGWLALGCAGLWAALSLHSLARLSQGRPPVSVVRALTAGKLVQLPDAPAPDTTHRARVLAALPGCAFLLVIATFLAGPQGPEGPLLGVLANPLVFLLVAGLLVSGGLRQLKRVAGRKISERVAQSAEATPHVPVPAPPVDPPQVARTPPRDEEGREGRRPDDGPTFQVLAPRELPPASDAARARAGAIEQRPLGLRRVQCEAIGLLVVAYVLLALTRAWVLPPGTLASTGETGQAADPGRFPVGSLVFGAITGALLWVCARGGIRLPQRRTQTRPDPPRLHSRVLGKLHLVWLVSAVSSAGFWAGAGGPAPGAFALAALASAGASVGWSWWRRRGLERDLPYEPPLDLLALRVFGSRSLDDFLDLTSRWRWVGTRQQLDGPETAGGKLRDVLNVVTGRVEQSIVQAPEELRAELARFGRSPDRDLRFPINSMQCTNATWKPALDVLLAGADVTVMDLTTFSAQHHGCAYELGRLLDRFPLERAVLLIDDETDREALEEILRTAWRNLAPESPNRGARATVRLLDVGGPSRRRDDEGSYEWRQRIAERLNPERLVELLCDAALPPRTSKAGDLQDEHPWLRWTRPRRPLPIRLAMAAFWALLLLSSGLATFRSLLGEAPADPVAGQGQQTAD